MSVPYQPQNIDAQQSDGNILITWSGSLGSTSYQVQRSLDGVNFTNLATTSSTQYVDPFPGVGIQYYYQVAGMNLSGTGSYSSVTSMVAAPPAEMSLGELRLRSQQCADRVESNFVTTSEWNSFIRLAMYELYDILMTSYEDYFAQDYVTIQTDGTTFRYPLPDGTNYLGGTFPNTVGGTPAKAFYKLAGMDLNVNTSTVTPSRVSLLRFDFIKRNQYVYPNSTSTIYGVYNMRYRIMGNYLNIIPTPAGNQTLIMWYSGRLPGLLQDTDLTTIGISGWLRYVIVRAAKYALDKEEGSDTSKLDTEIVFLKQRIEQASSNRDAGIPDTISDTRVDPIYGGTGFGGGTSNGGWAMFLLPSFFPDNIGHGLLVNSVFSSYFNLALLSLGIFFSYFFYLKSCQLSCGVLFTGITNKLRIGSYVSSFRNFISHIIKRGADK
jgi:hypothetical protein